MERNCYVFKRSATSFETFASARKITVRKGLTAEEARTFCMNWNAQRTAAQVKAGTKMEWSTK